MELALNLVWLVCAVALSALLWRRLARSRWRGAGGLTPWQSVVMLGCALAILFPVISMSDDLVEMQCLIEDAPLRSGTQMRARGAAAAQLGGPQLWLAAFQCARSLPIPRTVLGRAEVFETALAVRDESQHSVSRAPPVSPA